MDNILLLTDSYKLSHFNQYPEKTEVIHSYLMSRGGEYSKIYWWGLRYYLVKYLEGVVVTQDKINEAKAYAEKHGVPFYEAGWQYILEQHEGKLPVIIKALPEGSVALPNQPLLTIENTDPNCFWLVGYLETLLLKVWYTTTVASKALSVRDIIEAHYRKTVGDISGVDFAYHNFGDRGSTSVEAAALGGLAHLTQFKGTDNFNCLKYSQEYYNGKYVGFSIPASEHSTVTSWGKKNEYKMIESYLEKYKGKAGLIACVLDSYNIFEAVDFVTSGVMKDKIESAEYPIFVIRPDSGDYLDVLDKILHTMEKNNVAFTVNEKGYKVFNKYRVIWGDGITPEIINHYLTFAENLGYAASNFAFGSGGDLMQNLTRDTCKFAIKCSAIKVDGEWYDVFKDPITDQGKKSLKGRIEDSRFFTMFHNGKILWTETL